MNRVGNNKFSLSDSCQQPYSLTDSIATRAGGYTWHIIPATSGWSAHGRVVDNLAG